VLEVGQRCAALLPGAKLHNMHTALLGHNISGLPSFPTDGSNAIDNTPLSSSQVLRMSFFYPGSSCFFLFLIVSSKGNVVVINLLDRAPPFPES